MRHQALKVPNTPMKPSPILEKAPEKASTKSQTLTLNRITKKTLSYLILQEELSLCRRPCGGCAGLEEHELLQLLLQSVVLLGERLLECLKLLGTLETHCGSSVPAGLDAGREGCQVVLQQQLTRGAQTHELKTREIST
jgi:hypothetical protein